MISVKTHGKLYVAGEYQVLNKGGNAILLGLNRYIYFDISRAKTFSYTSRNNTFNFTKENERVIFNDHHNKLVEKTFETVFAYLNSLEIPVRPFSLVINSELESEAGIKYGFGSSSAIKSGIIEAVLLFHDVSYTKEQLFKLAVLSQISLNDLSSGGDIAASIYGGWIYYERYDLNWVLENVGKLDLVNEKWPNLVIEELRIKNINLLAAWTKIAYKTEPLKKEISIRQNKRAYDIVLSLKKQLLLGNILEVNKDIKRYDKWLKRTLRNSNRYTEKLDLAIKLANKHKFAAKISGAGGGDSAIVIYSDNNDIEKLSRELLIHNIEPFIF